MAKVQIPRGAQSPTAHKGKSDFRDDVIYSSVVLGNGGTGSQKMFTVPQGQNVLRMASAAQTESHQLTHSELTTNLEKAGELGAAIGDASVRSISLILEAASQKSNGT